MVTLIGNDHAIVFDKLFGDLWQFYSVIWWKVFRLFVENLFGHLKLIRSAVCDEVLHFFEIFRKCLCQNCSSFCVSYNKAWNSYIWPRLSCISAKDTLPLHCQKAKKTRMKQFILSMMVVLMSMIASSPVSAKTDKKNLIEFFHKEVLQKLCKFTFKHNSFVLIRCKITIFPSFSKEKIHLFHFFDCIFTHLFRFSIYNCDLKFSL